MSEQVNKDKDREYFFLERTAFDKTFLELNKKKAPRFSISWILSIFGTLLVTVFTTDKYKSIVGIPADVIEWTIYILLFISLTLFIIFGVFKIVSKLQKKWEILTVDLVKDALEKYSEELNIYNVLLIIPDFKNKKLSFLAKKHTQWQDAIFLPYIRYSSKKEFMELNYDKLNEKIHSSLITDINLEYKYLPGMDISNDVKYHKDEQYLRRYNFKFVLVYPKSNFLTSIFIETVKKKEGFSFFDVDTMEKDLSSMVRNREVIKELRANSHSLQQKINMLNRNENRIVWNISKQCNETCEFCAFGNTTNEDSLSHIDISQLIEKLNVIKPDIIDISTGDIIDINYLKNCIIELKKEGYRIHLTATAKIIDLLNREFISDYISMIEFTYDSPGSGSHRSMNYNETNYSCIKKLSKELRKDNVTFKALIILYSHLSLKMFKDIIAKLIKINVYDVTLIRLMPVGLMSNKQYPPKLMEKKFYNDYINFTTKNSMKIEPHCSFDGLVNKDTNYCNKGITKLSMSPSGDIYNCPWGEHLSEGYKIFSLGNIFRDDIIDIVNKQKFKNIGCDKFSCEIFNVAMKEDFLYKE
jgi:MoaA/NifB/PqqE/SkfB family radical SAM enzyme